MHFEEAQISLHNSASWSESPLNAEMPTMNPTFLQLQGIAGWSKHPMSTNPWRHVFLRCVSYIMMYLSLIWNTQAVTQTNLKALLWGSDIGHFNKVMTWQTYQSDHVFFFFFTQRSTNIPWTVNLYFRFHLGLKVFYFFFLLLPLFLYMEIFLFSHKIHFHDSPNNKLHLEIDCCKNTIFQSSWTTKVRLKNCILWASHKNW